MKQGECINSEFLTVVPVSDVGECITECQLHTFGGEMLCNDYTFYDDSKVGGEMQTSVCANKTLFLLVLLFVRELPRAWNNVCLLLFWSNFKLLLH